MDASIQSAQAAMSMANSAPIAAPQKSANYRTAHEAAEKFEGVFVGQFLNQMFAGVKTDGPFGGGQGEKMFRSLMLNQYGKEIASRGGFGLSNAITSALLSHQETHG